MARSPRLEFATLSCAVLIVSVHPALAQQQDEAIKLFNRAKTHYLLRDFPQAIRDWERARKLRPDIMAIHANLAKAYAEVGRYRDALTASRKAIKFPMKTKAAANVWGDIGGLEGLLGNPRKAVEAHRRAQALEPDSPRHWMNLANVLRELGRSREALEAYEECLALEPKPKWRAVVKAAIEDLKLVLARSPSPTLSNVVEVNAARQCARWLDFKGAYAALKASNPNDAAIKNTREELEARAAFLDALGAAVPSNTKVVASQSGSPSRVDKVSRAGIQLAGAATPILWSELPRGTVQALVASTEKSVKLAHLGGALLLYDLGLWSLADRRLKSLIDAQPAARAQAFEILARYRGLVKPPDGGFVWKDSEWLTPGERESRSKDTVEVDKGRVSRAKARRLIKQQQRSRRAAKRGDAAEALKRTKAQLARRGVREVRTIVSSGDPLKRADVVVVSDGFTAAELPRFKRLADSVAKAVLTVEPYRSYTRYVNVHRITVVSEESGLAGSRMAAKLEQGGILGCDPQTAESYGRLAPDADLVVVIVNVKEARPTGRPGLITMDASADFDQVVLHELGHAIAGLDDEYVDTSLTGEYPDYGPGEESQHFNTTRERDPRRAKWHYWLLPPNLPPQDQIGCFEGAYYRERGYYRPAKRCRMNDQDVPHYCAVCLERVELSFYSRIEPIDDVTVRAPHVALWKGQSQRLSATTISISRGRRRKKLGSFQARWYVDDQQVSSRAVRSKRQRTTLNLNALKLEPGTHEVVLRVDLQDVRIRRDGGRLSSLRAWRVNVSDAKPPRIVAPKRVRVRRGELVDFEIWVKGGSADLWPQVSGPAGSALVHTSGRSLRFVWAPPRHARGLYQVRIEVGNRASTTSHATEVIVEAPTENVPPVFRDQGLVRVRRGKELFLRLDAFDADGDGLVFTCGDLPAGAELDAMTGTLRWTPSYSTPLQAQTEITVRVSDGADEDEVKVKIAVDNSPLDVGTDAFDVLLATRAVSPDVRRRAFPALLGSDLPRGGKLLELVRLLRDEDPEIAAKARQALEASLEVTERSTRGLIVQDLTGRVWQFVDRPKTLEFLRRLAEQPLPPGSSKAAAGIRKALDAIKTYNSKRGVR